MIKQNKKGVIPLLAIIVIALIVGGAGYFVIKGAINPTTGEAITGNVVSNEDTSTENTANIISNEDITSAVDTTNNNLCVSEWNCGGWSACKKGERTRTCIDVNGCSIPNNEPSLALTCGGGGGSSTPAPAVVQEPVQELSVSGELTQIILLSNNEGLGTPIVISNSGDTEKTVSLSSVQENGIGTSYVGELILTKKNVDFGNPVWTIPEGAQTVNIEYAMVGNEFSAQVTNPISGYELIYYKDNSDRFNSPAKAIKLSEIVGNLPYADDKNTDEYDYCVTGEYTTCHGAKIWYVPSADINPDGSLNWADASNFFYETGLIQFNADENLVIYPHSSVTITPHVSSLSGELQLTSKNTADWTVTDTMKATIYYTLVGDIFEYRIEGINGFNINDYALIYYKDGVVGLEGRLENPQPAIEIVTDIGNLPQSDDANLNADYSQAPDYYLHKTGAKLWLVPISDINTVDKTLNWANWNNYLYETDLITYLDKSETTITITVA